MIQGVFTGAFAGGPGHLVSQFAVLDEVLNGGGEGERVAFGNDSAIDAVAHDGAGGVCDYGWEARGEGLVGDLSGAFGEGGENKEVRGCEFLAETVRLETAKEPEVATKGVVPDRGADVPGDAELAVEAGFAELVCGHGEVMDALAQIGGAGEEDATGNGRWFEVQPIGIETVGDEGRAPGRDAVIADEIVPHGFRGADEEVGSLQQWVFAEEVAGDEFGIEGGRLPIGESFLFFAQDAFCAEEDVNLGNDAEAALAGGDEEWRKFAEHGVEM